MATKSRVNQRTFLPFPVSGVDFRRPLFDMPPTISPFMQNFLVDTGYGRKRPPHTLAVASGDTSADNWAAPLVTQSGAAVISVQVGLTDNDTTTSVTPSEIFPASLAYLEFRNTIFVPTSGTGAGGGNVYTLNPTTLAWTSAFTFTAFSGRTPICSYRERVYVGAGTNLFYGGAAAVSGAMTAFSVQGLINGSICALAEYQVSAAFSPQYLLVIGSTSGDILVYSGSNPGGSDWSLVSKLKLQEVSASLGNSMRFLTTPSDVLISSSFTQSIWSLRALLTTGASVNEADLADPLKPYFEQATASLTINAKVKKDAVYEPNQNAVYLFAWFGGHPILQAYQDATYWPVMPTTAIFLDGIQQIFRIDLSDGAITTHSIPATIPIIAPVAGGGYVYANGFSSNTNHFIVRCFDDSEKVPEDYVPSAPVPYPAMAKFAPVLGPYRQRKMNNLILHSNLSSDHTFQYQCVSGFNANATTFNDYSSSYTDTNIHQTPLSVGVVDGTAVVAVTENGSAENLFNCYGCDITFEDGGEF